MLPLPMPSWQWAFLFLGEESMFGPGQVIESKNQVRKLQIKQICVTVIQGGTDEDEDEDDGKGSLRVSP